MKRLVLLLTIVLVLVSFAGLAMATPKWVAAVPSADANGNVVIPAMPAGATLLNVEIYDDVNGSRPRALGAVSRFKLEPGQGFNFIWKDSHGTWFQMITPQTRVAGLVTDCSWIDPKTGQPACKYLFPVK